MHINKEHEKEIMKGKIMLPKNFKDDYRAMTEKSFEFLGGGTNYKASPAPDQSGWKMRCKR